MPSTVRTVLGVFLKNSEFQIFQKTPKTVLFITDQPNIAQRPFFYSKRTTEYPLSPHIKTIAVAYLQAE